MLYVKHFLDIDFLGKMCYHAITFVMKRMFNTDPHQLERSKNDPEVYYGVGTFLLEMIKVFLLAAAIIIPIRVFLFQPFFVKGASMEPNFSEGNYLIINEWGYKETKLDFNGIDFSVEPSKLVSRQTPIVIRSPESAHSNGAFFIKRVIGLPGETVVIENGKVKIINKEYPDGFFLDESAYLHPSVKTTGSGVTLKDDEYFVMGDNRGNSSDSRSWGPLKRDKVIGIVLLRVLPMTSFK